MPNPRGSILRPECGLDRATRVCGSIAQPSRPLWKSSPLSVLLRRLARRGVNERVSLSASCEQQHVDLAPPTPKPKRRAHKGRRLRAKKHSNASQRQNIEVPVNAIPRQIDPENDNPSHAWDELTCLELRVACIQGGVSTFMRQSELIARLEADNAKRERLPPPPPTSSTTSPKLPATGVRDARWQHVHQLLHRSAYPAKTVDPPATTPAIFATQKYPQPLTMSPLNSNQLPGTARQSLPPPSPYDNTAVTQAHCVPPPTPPSQTTTSPPTPPSQTTTNALSPTKPPTPSFCVIHCTSRSDWDCWCIRCGSW